MKIFTLTLLIICNVLRLTAQVSQDVKLSLEREISPNADVLPTTIDYGEFQRSFIERNRITRQTAYRCNIRKDGRTDSVLLWVSNFIYDDRNRIIEQQEFDGQKKLLVKKNYYYNEIDALIEKTISPTGRSESASEITHVRFTYDSLGRVVYTSLFNQDTSYLITTKNIYNEKGYIIEHLLKMEVGNLRLADQSKKLAIDVYKQIFKVNQFHKVDSLFYNSDNKIVGIQEFDIAHKPSSFYGLEYNVSDPIEVSVTEQINQENYFVAKTLRNRLGQILTRFVPPEKTLTAEYNGENDVIEKFTYNADGTLNTCIGYNGKKVKYICKFAYEK
jgi:hypothetical protein